MAYSYGGYWQAGTNLVPGGGGGGGATNLSGLNDVQLSALSTGQVLTYNAVAGKWQNQAAGGFGVLAGLLSARPASPTTNAIYIVAGDTNTNNGRTFVYQLSTTTWREISPPFILTGTLASRPLTTTINTLYIVSGDANPANNGSAAIYNTALSAWIPLAGGATTAMATGTLASRPASPTIDTMYVVSGDSATNNGRSFYYNLATTTWIEMVEPDILSGTLASRPANPAINTLYVVNGDGTASNNERLFFYRASTSTWTELNYVQKDGDTMSGTLILEPTSGSALQVKDFGTGDVIFEIDPLLVNGIFYSPGAYSSPGSGEITELSGGIVNVASGATNPTNPNYTTVTTPGFVTVDNGAGVPPAPTLAGHLTNKKYVDEHLGGLDLNVTLPAPINGDGLIYDLANTEWKTQRFTKSVNGSFPDPLGDITVSLTKVETGTLAARPPAGTVTLTNGEVYIVSGDPTASNNGRTFIYKTSTSLWYEINSLGGIGVADIRVVSYLGSNSVGTGTFNAPYQTIQYAINQTNFGTATVIVVLPGTYTENISTSTHLNLSIVGLTSSLTTYPIEIIGSITISGTATRVRVKDVQVQGNAGAPVPLVINGSVGRHVFDNVQFIPFTTSNCVTFTGTPQNFFTFTDCGFSSQGIVDLGSTNNSAACYFIRPRNLLSLRIPSIWSGGVSVTDSDYLGIVHSASGLGLFNCRQISSFTSTATSANGALYVHDSSCYVAPTNTYTVVNKTGTAPYRFRNFEIARAGNTINGVEMDTANVNRYIKLNDLQNVDLVTTPPTNGQTLIYDSANTKWIPGAASGGSVSLFKVVAPGGSDITGTGGFDKPYATIANAITQAGAGGTVICLAGTYNEVVTLNSQNGIMIMGLSSAIGSYGVTINGGFILTGTTTGVKIRDLAINGTVANPEALVDNNSVGNHYFYNVKFDGFIATSVKYFTPDSNHEYTDCSFDGTFNTGNALGINLASIKFYRPRNLTLTIPNAVPGGVYVYDADTVDIIQHAGSPLYLSGIDTILGLTSTATTVNGGLYVDNCSMYDKVNNVYTVLNKTGNADYRFRNFQVNRAGGTLNGTAFDVVPTYDFTKLRDIQDVDLLTTPPAADNVLKFDQVGGKWVPGTAGGGYTYAATAPLFASISVGHIWINSTTMEQFIYIKDDSNADVWISLGNPAPASSGSYSYSVAPPASGTILPGHIWVKSDTFQQFIYITDDNGVSNWTSLGTTATTANNPVMDAVMFPNPVIYENISDAWQDTTTTGVPTVDFKMRRFGTPAGFVYNNGTFSGKVLANIGNTNVAGNGIAIKVPAGYNTVWIQFFVSPIVLREHKFEYVWNTPSWSTVNTVMVQHVYGPNVAGQTPQHWNAVTPYGMKSKQTHYQDFAWRMCTLPDSNGGILYVNNVGSSAAGGNIAGLAITKNPYNITQCAAFEVWSGMANSMIPATPAHPTLTIPASAFYDHYLQIPTNVSKRLPLPYVKNGKDKMIIIEQFDNYWNMGIPWDGFYINGVKIPEVNIRAVSDFMTSNFTMRSTASVKKNMLCIRVPASRMQANTISNNWAEFTISTTGANDAWSSFFFIHTYDIPYNADNQF